MTDRFKATLGSHPAWRNGITIPAALIRQYKALGLDNGKLAYVVQIIAAYWQDEEAGHKEIGEAIGVSPRQLRRYNDAMQADGLIEINGRYMHGNRLENDYDLTPLLDAALALDIEQGRNKQQRIDTAYSLIDQLVDAVDGKGNVQELLEQLSGEWRKTAEKPSGHPRPLESGHQRPLETGHPRPIETGHPRPLSTGHERPLSIGHERPNGTRLNQADTSVLLKQDTHVLSSRLVGSSPSLSFKNNQQTNSDPSLIPKLQKLGASKNKAREIIHHAIKSYGEESGPVLNNWIAYVESQDTFTHPALYILGRVQDADEPPIIAAPVPAVVIESAAQSQAAPALREI